MARILLADDDQGSLDFVRRALEMDGHVVIATQDGNEALEQLKSGGSFDVLVSDVNMPGLNGIALAEKAADMGSSIKLVLMSGFADVLDKAKGLEARGARLVLKPFPIDRIRAEVRAVLGA
ncbi:MAG: response regulator [Bacteroidota bacterium]|jgi:DNA-binding response OmpR family regulator